MARNVAGISLQGKPETLAAFARVKSLMNSSEVQDAILPAAMVVRDLAKRLVNLGPGKGGHLRDFIFATKGKLAKGETGATADFARSIYGDEFGNAAGPSVIAGIDLKKAPHAALVEFGHGGPHPAPPHPFMRPAAASARPLAIQIIEDGLRRLLAPFSR